MAEVKQCLDSEKTCLDYIQWRRWGGNVACPYCGSTIVATTPTGFMCQAQAYDTASDIGGGCRRGFTAVTDTIYDLTVHPLRLWMMATYVYSTQKDVYSLQLANAMDIDREKAYNMLPRLKNIPSFMLGKTKTLAKGASDPVRSKDDKPTDIKPVGEANESTDIEEEPAPPDNATKRKRGRPTGSQKPVRINDAEYLGSLQEAMEAYWPTGTLGGLSVKPNKNYTKPVYHMGNHAWCFVLAGSITPLPKPGHAELKWELAMDPMAQAIALRGYQIYKCQLVYGERGVKIPAKSKEKYPAHKSHLNKMRLNEIHGLVRDLDIGERDSDIYKTIVIMFTFLMTDLENAFDISDLTKYPILFVGQAFANWQEYGIYMPRDGDFCGKLMVDHGPQNDSDILEIHLIKAMLQRPDIYHMPYIREKLLIYDDTTDTDPEPPELVALADVPTLGDPLPQDGPRLCDSFPENEGTTIGQAIMEEYRQCLRTINNYAALHNVTTSYIRQLVNDDKLHATIIDGVQFINIKTFPCLPTRQKVDAIDNTEEYVDETYIGSKSRVASTIETQIAVEQANGESIALTFNATSALDLMNQLRDYQCNLIEAFTQDGPIHLPHTTNIQQQSIAKTIKYGGGIGWTKEEDEILRINYPKLNRGESLMAQLPGRSEKAIEVRATRIGVKRDKANENAKNRLFSKHNTTWTKVDEGYLKQHYGTMPIETLMENLGRSKGTIYTKAHELGLSETIDPDWTDADVKYLTNNITTKKVADIAVHLDRTENAVAAKMRRMGISKSSAVHALKANRIIEPAVEQLPVAAAQQTISVEPQTDSTETDPETGYQVNSVKTAMARYFGCRKLSVVNNYLLQNGWFDKGVYYWNNSIYCAVGKRGGFPVPSTKGEPAWQKVADEKAVEIAIHGFDIYRCDVGYTGTRPDYEKDHAKLVDNIHRELERANFSDRKDSLGYKAAVIMMFVAKTDIRDAQALATMLNYQLSDVLAIFANWGKNGVYKNGLFNIEAARGSGEKMVVFTATALIGEGVIYRLAKPALPWKRNKTEYVYGDAAKFNADGTPKTECLPVGW